MDTLVAIFGTGTSHSRCSLRFSNERVKLRHNAMSSPIDANHADALRDIHPRYESRSYYKGRTGLGVYRRFADVMLPVHSCFL
jgi:hypothetical protein